MLALFRFFVELALLRRGPQDLPASPALLALLAGLNVLVGAANGTDLFGGARAAFGANLLDLLLSMLLLFALLQFKGHLARWQQTATAFFGLGVLAGLIMLFIRTPAESLGITGLAMLLDVVLAIWLHVALGNVLRHALGIPLMPGVIIVLSYTVLAFNLIARIFPPVVNL
ncbi:MAG: hypothetical protein WBM59_12720 [Sedimenticolaceae bacterium]|jgi:hypothetical protein